MALSENVQKVEKLAKEQIQVMFAAVTERANSRAEYFLAPAVSATASDKGVFHYRSPLGLKVQEIYHSGGQTTWKYVVGNRTNPDAVNSVVSVDYFRTGEIKGKVSSAQRIHSDPKQSESWPPEYSEPSEYPVAQTANNPSWVTQVSFRDGLDSRLGGNEDSNQFDALNYDISQSVMLTGGPGTGKSNLLYVRFDSITFEIQQSKVVRSAVLFTYNPILRDYIQRSTARNPELKSLKIFDILQWLKSVVFDGNFDGDLGLLDFGAGLEPWAFYEAEVANAFKRVIGMMKSVLSESPIFALVKNRTSFENFVGSFADFKRLLERTEIATPGFDDLSPGLLAEVFQRNRQISREEYAKTIADYPARFKGALVRRIDSLIGQFRHNGKFLLPRFATEIFGDDQELRTPLELMLASTLLVNRLFPVEFEAMKIDYSIVDEFQDYPHAVVKLIKTLTRISITLSGDPLQRIHSTEAYDYKQDVNYQARLFRYYRSSVQNLYFAKRALDIKVLNDEVCVRSLFKPILRLTQDPIAEVLQAVSLIQKKFADASIAVVFFDLLDKNRFESHLQSFEGAVGKRVEGVEYLMNDEVKGLEFNFTILFRPSVLNLTIKEPLVRNRAFVSFTRAKDGMVMVDDAKPWFAESFKGTFDVGYEVFSSAQAQHG